MQKPSTPRLRAQEFAIGSKQRRTDRNTTLGQPRSRFGDRDVEHLLRGTPVVEARLGQRFMQYGDLHFSSCVFFGIIGRSLPWAISR